MRKKIIQNAALFVALIPLLALSGCSNPFTPPAGKKTTATVTLSINGGNGAGGARTIMPAIGEFPKVTVEFDNGTPADKIGPLEVTGGEITVEMKVGNWTATAKGYLNVGTSGLIDATQPVATGTSQFEIGTALDSQKVNIVLLADNSGTGTFVWSISIENEIDNVEMSIKQLNSDMTLLSGGFSEIYRLGDDKEPNDTQALPVGFYSVTFELTKGSQTVEWKELLYIYRNMNSVFTHSFTVGMFPLSLLEIVLNAVKTGGYVYRDEDVTPAHFTLLGVKGINTGNFEGAKADLKPLIGGNNEPTDLAQLKALVDATLISLALGDSIATWDEANPDGNKTRIEGAVGTLVAGANGSTNVFGAWTSSSISAKATEHTATVTVGGKYGVKVTLTISPEITHITVNATSVKKDYYEGISGQTLDLAGLAVTATYTDSTVDPVSSAQYSSNPGTFNTNTPGTYTITISYAGKTGTFAVTVHALSSLTVSGGAGNVGYVFDTRPSLSMIRTALTNGSITVTAVYANSHTENISSITYITVAAGSIAFAGGSDQNNFPLVISDQTGYDVTINWRGKSTPSFRVTISTQYTKPVNVSFDITEWITDKAASIAVPNSDLAMLGNAKPHTADYTVSGSSSTRWLLNGVEIGITNSLHVNTAVAPFNRTGTHTVTVIVTIGGEVFSKTFTVTVSVR